ncbi:MAG: DUF268 domain-containing protein, partial [Rubrivivax sp.]
MSSLKRRFGIGLVSFGFDPRRTLGSLRFLLGYWRDLSRWRQVASAQEQAQFPLRLLPTLSDKHADSGIASGHYFHQDLWAARLIHDAAPARHLDVGSRIDGFIAHLLCFRGVEVIDIRALHSDIEGLRFRQADLMSDTPLNIEAADSVSCLHALEHFGLGRYGDPVRPDGWRTGLRNLAALVAPGGCLYLGVPIGQPAVEFNAQRIFDPGFIVEEAARHGLRLDRFAHVDDAGRFHVGSTEQAITGA